MKSHTWRSLIDFATLHRKKGPPLRDERAMLPKLRFKEAKSAFMGNYANLCCEIEGVKKSLSPKNGCQIASFNWKSVWRGGSCLRASLHADREVIFTAAPRLLKRRQATHLCQGGFFTSALFCWGPPASPMLPATVATELEASGASTTSRTAPKPQCVNRNR